MKSMQKGFTLIELMIVVAIIAILAAIAIPQYQTYVIKSQVSRAMGEAGDAKVVVEDCLNNGGTAIAAATATGKCVPNQLTGSDILSGAAQGGQTIPSGTGVAQITLEATGSASIVATMGNHASAKVSGGTITWTRTGSGSWSCQTAGAISDTYAPASCQN